MAKRNSILNGIFKGVWETFSDLNDDLRSGTQYRVQGALFSYFIGTVTFIIFAALVVAIVAFIVTGGSSYKCLEYRDDGLRTYYNTTTKTTTVTREKTCMVQVHKEFTGSVEIK